MTAVVRRSLLEPIRSGLSWHQIWDAEDRGLIQCWENGRQGLAISLESIEAARRGELPILHWKGGIAGKPKLKKKYGALYYLATWQGMRGEDLLIDLKEEVSIVCTRTGVSVTFTSHLSKLDADSDLSLESDELTS